jgi:hypothetical protein
MQFLTIRCLACQNLDSFPRRNYDEIPYCSQASSLTYTVFFFPLDMFEFFLDNVY